MADDDQFEDDEPDDTQKALDAGLPLLGWRNDVRLTTEDGLLLERICTDALEHEASGTLTADLVDSLAAEAYNVLKHQLVDVQERADAASTIYQNSVYLRPLLPLIDEATLAFFRGYDLACLSIQFVLLERYLRSVAGWRPGDGHIGLDRLKAAVLGLPRSDAAREAHRTLGIVYSHYDPLNPTQFLFNRHGLLHGLRGPSRYDQMNCARIFLLLDQLCRAEGVQRTGWGRCLEMFRNRHAIYQRAVENRFETMLLSIDYSLPDPPSEGS